MPLYSFYCGKCGVEEEHVVPYEQRNETKFKCTGLCGQVLERRKVECINLGKGRHQTAVVLGSGETVQGNFGGGYRMKRKKR